MELGLARHLVFFCKRIQFRSLLVLLVFPLPIITPLRVFSPPRTHVSSQTSFAVPDQDFSGQFPEPSPVSKFPFQSRVNTWAEGLVAKGFDRDVAFLATKSNKPSTHRQFQSGWKQAESYFAKNHLRLEDVSGSSFANFLGRQFLDEGLAASTVMNHFYACIKPAKFKFNLDLDQDKDIKDVISGNKKE